MAVPAGPTDKRYIGNGVTTIFSIPFLLLSSSDLDVFVNGVEVLSGFTITGAGNPTSTITFTVAPADLSEILLSLNVPFERLNDYQENGDFLSSTVNRDFDRIWQALKQLLRFSTRALTLGFFDADGAGAYRAKGNRISGLSDPVDGQDATTKHAVEIYVGGLIQAGQGPINSAANVLYVAPNGVTRKVQDMSSKTDANLGAQLIGFKGRTVGDRLNDFVSSLDYAAGDGVTDDTAAWIVGMAFADARGVPFYAVPTPNGYVLGPLNIPCSVIGDKTKIIRKAGTTGTWLNVVDNGVKIQGLDIDGAWIAARCIEVDGYADVVISGNRPTRIGEYFIHFNGADRLCIEGNIYKYGTNGVSNIMPSGSVSATVSKDIKIKFNNFSELAGTGIQCAGKQLTGDNNYFKTNELVINADISDNVLKNLLGHGIVAQGRYITIAKNETDNCGNGSGLQSIVAQATIFSVISNVINGGKGVGIDLGWCTHGACGMNVINGSGEIGIEIQSCTNLACTGNSINNCGALNSGSGSAGITIAQGFFGAGIDSYSVTVSGNTIGGSGSAGKYGISIQANVKNLIVSGNHLSVSGTIGPMFVDPTARALIFGNITSNNEEDLFITYGITPKLVSRNSSGNGDLWLAPSGTGTLRLDKNFGTATTPGNFSAQSYIVMKDLSGNPFYIPARAAPW